MTMCENDFNIIRDQTKIYIWTEQSNRKLYEAIFRILRRCGFSRERDPFYMQNKKHFMSIISCHHYGSWQGLEYHSALNPAMIEFTFFQSLNFTHPNGGRYEFAKYEKMPFLIKMRFLKISNRIRNYLVKKGFVDKSIPTFKTGLEEIFHLREKSNHPAPQNYEQQLRHKAYYNIQDADGTIMKDGDIRYYRDHDGYLRRGTVYYNLNNMWWVDLGGEAFTNRANWELFSWKPDLKRHYHPEPEKKWAALMEKAAKDHKYEKAIIFRNLLQQKQPKPEIENKAPIHPFALL